VLAQKRIDEQKWFIIHSIVAAPTWLFLFLISAITTNDMYLPLFFTGASLTAYLIHAYQFAMPRIKNKRHHSISVQERKEKRLAEEVAKLKAELQKQNI